MKQTTWLALTLLVIFAVLFGLARRNTVKDLSTQPIKIGAVLPLTGPVAGLGEALKLGYTWKIEELNKEGKITSFYLEDSKSNAKDAVTAFLKLADVEKVPIIFTTMSAVSMTLRPIAEQRSVLLWADAAHPLLTRDTRFVLRHSNTSNKDAEVLANKVIELAGKKTGVLYQNDDWGVAASELLSGNLSAVGNKAVLEPIDNKSADFRILLTKLISQKIDSLVTIVAGPPSGIIIKQARELGFKGNIVSSVGIILTPDAQNLAGSYLKGTYYQTYDENPLFASDYRARFNAPPAAFTHVGYTDMELLMDAIEQTGTVDPTQIVRYIKGLKSFKGKYETVEITPEGDIIVPTIVKQWQ
ncbi:MAG: ABC transporter substrate-binding protein [Candidatus Taylorbacteria bacterium]|nr:ABC transporter substrate-binding protein [Candidatus Taylorbacteria bacterium]